MSRISLFISDVDGTLVTKDKVLTERSRTAVRRLDGLGIAFTIISSRPPFGLRMLVEPLALRLPIGAYNGGAIVMPDATVIEQRLVPPEAARRTLTVLRSHGIDIWLFSGARWLLQDPHGGNVDRETRTVQVAPTVVEHLEDHIEAVAKIVGVSNEFGRLDACEKAARATLGDSVSIARSQPYYLDVTPAGTDKGTAVIELARRLGVVTAEIATIGDMSNDVSMFRQSGFSIAMGNASPEVKSLADAVTLSNEEDGFAEAVERLIIPRSQS